MSHKRPLSVTAQLNKIVARAQYDARLRQHRDVACVPEESSRALKAPFPREPARGRTQQTTQRGAQKHLRREQGLVTALTMELLMLLTSGA